MNLRNVTALADFIEGGGLGFNMADAGVDLMCGSAGCIGGHASLLWPEIGTHAADRPGVTTVFSSLALAARLGIPGEAARDLCYMTKRLKEPRIYERVTREDAVKTLRKLASTGKVDWSHVAAPKQPEGEAKNG
jgi:hypothetical protein